MQFKKESSLALGSMYTVVVTFFQIALSRCSDAARDLLGENFGGILNERPIRSIQLGRFRAATIVLGTFKTEPSAKYQIVPEFQRKLEMHAVKQQEKLFELW